MSEYNKNLDLVLETLSEFIFYGDSLAGNLANLFAESSYSEEEKLWLLQLIKDKFETVRDLGLTIQ